VQGAVESLSREVMTIQAKGDKPAAKLLLDKYGTTTYPLQQALSKLETIKVRTLRLQAFLEKRTDGWILYIDS
jgi:hypothetical protein